MKLLLRSMYASSTVVCEGPTPYPAGSCCCVAFSPPILAAQWGTEEGIKRRCQGK
jgi:hypothetical protein